MQGVSRHRPQTLQRAWSVDADEFQILANVAVTGAAGGALVARIERTHGNAVAAREAVHARTDVHYGARHLMPENLRHMDAVIHRSMKDVEIGATDAAEGNADL